MSRSTPYHPQGNAQGERTVQTVWHTIRLLLNSGSLLENQWEDVLSDAVHSTPSLIRVAVNEHLMNECLSGFPDGRCQAALPTLLLNSWVSLCCDVW